MCDVKYVEGTKIIDITGNKYHNLKVIGFCMDRYIGDKHRIDIGEIKTVNKYWECKCDCGKTTIVSGQHLKSGHTKSCRCCYSFGDYLLDTYGENAISLYWSDKNTINPFDIPSKCAKKIYIKCHNAHHPDYSTTCSGFTSGNRCSVCSNQSVIKGVNDISTTHPELLKYFVNMADAYSNTYGTKKKFKFICQDCGRKKMYTLSNIMWFGLGCDCSDGRSYPNKFISEMLNQININFKTERLFEWSCEKRYDIYINDIKCVIENHGAQHYRGWRGNIRDLKKQQANDKLKRELALSNGIKHYIELDCCKSNVKWIKQSIMNSELPSLLNFREEDIDWAECGKFAEKNIVKEVGELWNTGNFKSAKHISEHLELGHKITHTYLVKATELGMCNYSRSKIEYRRDIENMRKGIEVFKDDVSIGVFKHANEIEDVSEDLLGIRLLRQGIGRSARGQISQYKGFKFRYIENTNKNTYLKCR